MYHSELLLRKEWGREFLIVMLLLRHGVTAYTFSTLK